MNTKKNKNKNRTNKPPNLNPPQKIDPIIAEKTESLPEEKPETIEERVPEIISEIVLPVIESEDKDDGMPRKPKRNRGKKKKQETGEMDNPKNQEQESEHVKVVNADVPLEITTELPTVAPCARKKKNKNKKTAEPDEKLTEETEGLKMEIKIEEKCDVIALKESENVSSISCDNTPDQEAKHKKKNKKKKNRTDSERSEKSEDVSCVAAFQKLLIDEKTDKKTNISDSNIETSDKITEKDSVDIVSKNILEDSTKEQTKDNLNEQSKTCAPEPSSKNKKKNKKDKKVSDKEDDKLSTETLEKDLSQSIESKLIKDTLLPKDESMDIVTETTEITKESAIESLILKNISTDEEIAKVKPTIAKPVERKRKGKTQDQIKESAPEIRSEVKSYDEVKPQDLKVNIQEKPKKEIKSNDSKDVKQINPDNIKHTEISAAEEAQKKPIDVSEKLESTEDMNKVINITPPACEMGKKRKKSPKSEKSGTVAALPSDSKSSLIDEPCKFEEAKQILPILSDIPKEVETITVHSEKGIKSEEVKPENVAQSVLPKESKPKEDNISECKTKKKRKKSPRLVVESEKETKELLKKEPITLTTDSITKETIKDKKNKKEEASKEKKDVIHDPIEDIEISSLKTDESEGSACGVTPDIIQFPRATSQDLMDDNNNMTIVQEITVPEESNFPSPIDLSNMPQVQDSGETPISTPELINIEHITTDTMFVINKPNEQEKTDLKSKMMEVNQDMEELRLSIERSLAELTAMEKCEEEVEKEFSGKMLHITEEKDITTIMPSEIVSKLPTEAKNDIAEKINDKDKETEKRSTTKKMEGKMQSEDIMPKEIMPTIEAPKASESNVEVIPPVCPSRKDHKNKGKNKNKKGKQEAGSVTQTESPSTPATSEPVKEEDKDKKETKSEQKSECKQEKNKQQSAAINDDDNNTHIEQDLSQKTGDFDPIESFEDAMTSSADDINKTFEMIANETNQSIEASHVNPEINIIAPTDETKQEKRDARINPVSQPKNLLGHSDIPVPSNRIDYKKEKNKSPNETLAKVKIKDSIQVEAVRESKESQTDNIRKFMKNKSIDETFSLMTNENEDFVYKYSFRKVFLQSACHVCKKDLKQSRVPCNYCNLVFYCNGKHKDEDWSQHQALCFAVSTIVHLKDQKHIYADSKDITGQNYRLLRMQMIVSCEKVLKRRLVPWEQEALLYPRVCADVSCRQWRQSKLLDCDGCGQISYCADHPDHFPKIHQRWCKSYSLYCKLVSYQQTKGRLEPKMPSKVMLNYQIPDKMNEVLASMYEEKIDMNDIQYAALTQIATDPLTTAYCYQTYSNHTINTNIYKRSCTIHVVGAELQFEADALNKWEVFFLHLMPEVTELRVVLIASDLNPSNLPLELLSKVKLCENCRLNNRKVVFSFQDKKTYHEYCSSEEYVEPNIVCTFNASINRSSLYNCKDPWPKTINYILKQRVPFLITSYTINEIHRDLCRIKECAERNYNVIIEPKNNSFASVRPDRNFISDDEMPLLFKNYCCLLVCGV